MRSIMKQRKKQNIRLPSHVKPFRYAIRLKPDLERFTFEGEETIHLALAKPEKRITLHSSELDIESAEVTSGGTKIFAIKITKIGFLILTLAIDDPLNESHIGFIVIPC